MPTDPALNRRIAEDTTAKRSYERTIQNLQQQIRILEHQDRDAKKLPNAGRAQTQIRDQVRQLRRSIDAAKQSIKLLDKQIQNTKALQKQLDRQGRR